VTFANCIAMSRTIITKTAPQKIPPPPLPLGVGQNECHALTHPATPMAKNAQQTIVKLKILCVLRDNGIKAVRIEITIARKSI
jgi:hypothetical protein